jgi:hypothetical protein
MRGISDPDLQRELQRTLYGLYAIIRLHVAKEEEVYLPLLDVGLAPVEANDMFRAMHEPVSASAAGRHAAKHHQSIADQERREDRDDGNRRNRRPAPASGFVVC